MIPDSVIKLLSADYTDPKRFHKAINLLKKPQNILKKKLIIKLANGKKGVFQSLRIQYNDARGPFIGGTQYAKNLNEDQIKKLAFEESIKSAIAGIQFGGAFGGIDVDSKKIKPKDVERLSKNYSQFLTSHIGAWKDIFSTNTGLNKETQSWMMDAYERKKKFHSPATFVINNWNLDGAVYILQEYLKSTNFASRFRKLDVAICGFETRGYLFANNLKAQNYRVVAISDKSGGVVNSNGFDIIDLKKLKDKFTTLKEVSVMCQKEFISEEKLLELPVDILVIATDYKIEVKIKNEILPSLLLDSGFSVLSHLSWVQKMHGYNWTREEVLKKLQHSMVKIFLEIKQIVDEKKIIYEEACCYLGVKRIIDAMMERGRV